MATDLFKTQHQRIRELSDQIRTALKLPDPARAAATARDHLAKMAGTLTVHLAAEDQVLYPRLSADKRREVSEVARRFQQEMGGLKETFGNHVKRWTSDTVATDQAGFARETLALLGALATRMDREERELYPLDG